MAAGERLFRRSSASLIASIVAAALIFIVGAKPALSQSGPCALIADDRNPSEKVLKCGATLEVRNAPGAVYHLEDSQLARQPKALQLNEGAVMVEFHPNSRRRTFQILTPQAIAAVRGTKWVVDVAGDKTSTFVISGVVAVSRPSAEQTVLLRPGQGVDVSADSGPLVVKRWAEERVRALLARFGE
jgi:ferric-dicitrate binding protein FerR (iron transport regulator)